MKFRFMLQSLAVVVFTLAVTSLAQAQATRTWVSGVGDDVNPCSRTAPCKTWAGAISKTAAGGEIDALDPGGYGTLTITKSITVDGTTGAGWGSTLNSGGINGFVINDSATGAPGTIKVQLRNLSINGAGTTKGLNGIRFITGKSLSVENVRIQNQSSHGIDIAPGATAGNPTLISIVNTFISDCDGSGINSVTGGPVLNTFVDHSTIARNGTGITVASGTVNVTNSNISNNTGNGVNVSTSGGVANLATNVFTNNGSSGLLVAVGATARIDECDFFRNGTGITNNGTTETYRNNRVRGNTTPTAGVALTDISAVNTGTF